MAESKFYSREEVIEKHKAFEKRFFDNDIMPIVDRLSALYKSSGLNLFDFSGAFAFMMHQEGCVRALKADEDKIIAAFPLIAKRLAFSE
jgi:hypothetical protein